MIGRLKPDLDTANSPDEVASCSSKSALTIYIGSRGIIPTALPRTSSSALSFVAGPGTSEPPITSHDMYEIREKSPFEDGLT